MVRRGCLAIALAACALAACAHAPAQPPPARPSEPCVAAEPRFERAELARRAGRLRAAAAELEDAVASCPSPPAVRALGELRERLGRASAQTSADRLARADALIARARGEAGPTARALLDAALDEIERATNLRAQPVTVAGAASAKLAGRWVWLESEGVLLDARSGSALMITPSYLSELDPGGRWLLRSASSGGADDGLSLWDLDERTQVLDRRPLAENLRARFLRGGALLVWFAPDHALHVFDTKAREERRFPIVGVPTLGEPPLSDLTITGDGKAALWVTRTADGAALDALDLDHLAVRRLAAQPKAVVDVTLRGESVAVAWEGGPLEVVRTDGARVVRLEVDAAYTALDDARIGWIERNDDGVAFVGTADLAGRGRRRVRLVGGTVPTSYQQPGPEWCSFGLAGAHVSVECGSPTDTVDQSYALATGRLGHHATQPRPDYGPTAAPRSLAECTRGPTEYSGCEGVWPTSAGPVVLRDGIAVRVDPETRAPLLTLEGSAGAESLASAIESPWIVDAGELLRAWDARTGKLAWSTPLAWCRIGVRLYPHELCD